MITVDTHIIVWDAVKPEMISLKAKNALDSADEILFCEISLWEIAMLMKKKRIEIGVPYREFITLVQASRNYIYYGITPEIAELAAQLSSDINLDPADRIICATSIITRTSLVTADTNLRKSTSVKTIW